jgi:hypothetical protein
MISFTGAQLEQIMIAAHSLPLESRDGFLRLGDTTGMSDEYICHAQTPEGILCNQLVVV